MLSRATVLPVSIPRLGASHVILSITAAASSSSAAYRVSSHTHPPQAYLGDSSSSHSAVDEYVKSLSPKDKHYLGLHTMGLFDKTDTFLPRHIGSGQSDIEEMCRVVGASSLKELIQETIPHHIMRDQGFLSITGARSESEALSIFKKMMRKNKLYKNFIGQGYHGTIVPKPILRNLAENPVWYTSYTPYQAEISQGRLESLMIFQTVVSELTGLPVANCSLLDEATAAAEAVTMIQRGVGNSTRKVMFISDTMHPQTIEVVKTRAQWAGIPLEIGDIDSFDFTRKDLIGAFVQYPDTQGVLRDFTFLADALKEGSGGTLAVAADPLALTVCKPPSDMGAQVVVGTMQRFGVPMWYGGPAAGYLATTSANTRRMAGRLVGVSQDAQGNPAYRLTLQTREQHIRLNKATSNVCTAQALLANMSAMYAVYHGPSGLTRIASRVHALGQLLVDGLQRMEVPVVTSDMFFDCVSMKPGSPEAASRVMKAAVAAGMNLRLVDPATVSATFDETHTIKDVEALLQVIATAIGTESTEGDRHSTEADLGLIPKPLRRITPYMSQKIFNSVVTETDLMRYLYYLQNKDISLTKSMITLGSCTMKLNSSSSMYTIVQEEVTTPHPFTPLNQMEGYTELLRSLERSLKEITGFAVCSLQPCSGAQGEFAGLLAIRQYHASRGDTQRSVCLIPRSAHGTNPASAAMMGFEIVWLDDDGPNGMDIDVLDRICSEIGDRLGALMITYPSTRGVFETHIKAICDTVHRYGGQVYMDGANMNAQLGLTSPGTIGADVCHLNLHKTFSIPHGGGGPGMGPICAAQHLKPFMPSHSVISTGTDIAIAGSVNAAPFGQAGIASIPWMFINMLGEEGLRASAEMAILNANYMAARLKDYYPLMHVNSNGRCSHEFIIDISDIRKHTGVVEEDIAKRLMDYGFHAPTMSWPVHHSLMIEPTESESKDELDRFCDALIQIRREIDQIAEGVYDLKDNPLKNAPHTEDMVTSEEWDHCYSREVAGFPLPWVRSRGKFWPSCARVNNILGDRHLTLKMVQ